MQLLDLQISNYKNLSGFHWEITEEFASPALLLMGKNASGKTNVLEALINIFDFLIHSKSKKAPFKFSITYKVESATIKISCKENEELDHLILNGDKLQFSRIKQFGNKWVSSKHPEIETLIPENIVLYYSGFSSRFHGVSSRFKKEYSNKFRKQKAVELPPIITLEPIHFQMILLALFSFNKGAPIFKDFFRKYFEIEDLYSFEIHIKKHTGWIKDHSYQEFFNTTGIVRNFIEELHKLQKREPKNNSPRLIKSKSDPKRVNRVIYNFQGANALLELKEVFGYEDDIFKLFNILYTTNNLARIEIKVKKENITQPIPFEWLSEGEQQFLAIKGMIYLLQGKNSLFLWDEPDTFLNPAWQWDLIPNLEKGNGYVEDGYAEEGYFENAIQRDQFILTTHSPVLLSTVKKQAYYIEKGEITPLRNTFGLTVDESLEKQSINTRIKSLDEKLRTYFELIEQGKSKEEEATNLRAELESKLGGNHEELQRADVLISFYE